MARHTSLPLKSDSNIASIDNADTFESLLKKFEAQYPDIQTSKIARKLSRKKKEGSSDEDHSLIYFEGRNHKVFIFKMDNKSNPRKVIGK